MEFKTIWRGVTKAVVHRAPEILTGTGIVGLIVAGATAVYVTPKAVQLCEEKKKELNAEKLTMKDTVKTVWKLYIPSVAMSVVSSACIIGANTVNARRNAVLATAYAASETALKEYRDKVVEAIGEKKEEDIRDAIVKEKVKANPVVNDEAMTYTKNGKTVFLDPYSGRYFTSDVEYVKRVVNELNRRMLDEVSVSLNDLYYELDLHPVKMGDDLGWCIDDGFIDIRLSAQLMPNDEPCVVLDYVRLPKPSFY